MRELNRSAFTRLVCEDPRIQMMKPFRFSVEGADALARLTREAYHEMHAVFQRVGGIGDMTEVRLGQLVKRLGSDDCLMIDDRPFVVEYDEVLHFTRFRKTTLESALYDDLAVGFDRAAYLKVCGTFAMTGGSGRAHNDSAHRDFRCPGSPGECRHRQRAFYDFLKDVILGSRLSGLPGIIRISDRTDFVGGQTPSQVIEDGRGEDRKTICDLLRIRGRATIEQVTIPEEGTIEHP